MKQFEKPIAVLDSGVGGISVLKELISLMPNENFIYVSDSLNAPYGTKTMEEVRAITFENVARLLKMGIKALVIACNTATGAAAKELRAAYPELPIIGIEPAIKPAMQDKPNPTVVVMATPLTLHQEKFQLLMSRFTSEANIIPLPCAGLMEIIEEGCIEGKRLDDYLEHLFFQIDKKRVDCVVLGCTHYPHVKKSILKALGQNVHVFDGGAGTAKETKRRLSLLEIENPSEKKGTVELTDTRGDVKKIALAERLLYGETHEGT